MNQLFLFHNWTNGLWKFIVVIILYKCSGCELQKMVFKEFRLSPFAFEFLLFTCVCVVFCWFVCYKLTTSSKSKSMIFGLVLFGCSQQSSALSLILFCLTIDPIKVMLFVGASSVNVFCKFLSRHCKFFGLTVNLMHVWNVNLLFTQKLKRSISKIMQMICQFFSLLVFF